MTHVAARTALALAAALALSACGGAQSAGSTTSRESAELPPAPTVTGAEARALVEAGAFLLDVTPPPRNERSGIEGAINIPLPELRDRMSEVPRDRVIVAYCLGGRGSPRAGRDPAGRGL